MEHKSETKTHSINSVSANCQNCKQDFTIEPEDFNFYEKIKVPPPTWCPECRMVRRMSTMNAFTLYKRNCDLCNKSIISIYHKDSPRSVYCMPCWWGDSWDGLKYEKDYDPSRTFFEQLLELAQSVPLPALELQYSTLVNTEYANFAGYLKNCYMTMFADYLENCYYVSFAGHVKDSTDCYRIRDSELCYESVGSYKNYRVFYSEECDNCVDVYFSKNCSSCTNCFGCINLRKQSNCIFNKQVSKEEYENFIKKFKSDSSREVAEYKEKAREFWLSSPLRSYYGNGLNLNVSGDYIYESKNTRNSYMVTSAENSKYVALLSVPSTKESYDYTGWGAGSELLYECQSVGEGAYNTHFSIHSYPEPLNLEYCVYAVSGCKELFGCMCLRKKSYCILNKQYSKDEYEKLREKIISEMETNPYVDANGRVWKYGEFPPIGIAPFAYNETFAQDFFPLTKEEAIIKGFGWHDREENQYTSTILSKDLPDRLSDVSDSILNEVIECECLRCYKISQGELKFLKRLNFPIPRKCPECRRRERFSRINLPKFFDRNCDKCGTDIKTSYAPDRPEIVYCEKCYQQEVY